jgi:hypothetical protein
MQRALFYQNQCLSNEDESIQRLGVIRICYFDPNTYSSNHGGPDIELLRASSKILYAMPLRNVAFYLVLVSAKDDEAYHHHTSPWVHAVELLAMLGNTFSRARTRIVCGKELPVKRWR